MNTVPLCSVAEIIMGTAPPGDSYNLLGEGLPLIAGAGDYGPIHPTPKKWTTEASAVSEPGDLIVCVRATIGDVNWADRQYCLGRGVAALRSRNGRIEPRYLGHFIASRKDSLAALGTGSTFPAIRKSDLETFEIPLPPQSEQIRIADILDKADAVRRKRRDAVSESEGFVSALFMEMFAPDGSPYSAAVREMSFDDAISDFIDYRGKTPEKSASGVPLVTAKVIKNGRVLPPDEFIPEEDYEAWMRRGLPKCGDVLFTTEAPLGEVAQVSDERIALAQRVLLMRGKAGVLNNTFLRLAIKTPYVWSQIQRRSTGSTVRGIRQKELRQVTLPVPSIHEQEHFERIAQRQERSMEVLRDAATESEWLFRSLVQRAFTGKL